MRACYLYYVEAQPMMEDYDFDKMHKMFLECWPDSAILNKIGSDNANDYPMYIVRGWRPMKHERRSPCVL